MNYLRKMIAGFAIRAGSAAVGFVFESNNVMDFKSVELILILVTAAALVGTIYNDKFKRIFPYWLFIKSGLDSIYILTLGKADFMTGLIIAANVIFFMVFACEHLIEKVLAKDVYSKFASVTFAVCFLIPYIAVFLSLAMVLLGVLFYEISLLVLIICLIVNACIFYKVCLVFVNLLLLTLKK